MTMAFWGKRVEMVPYQNCGVGDPAHIPWIYIKDVEDRYPKDIRKGPLYSVQAEGIGHIGFVADTSKGAMGEADVGSEFHPLPVPQLRLIDAIRLVVERYDTVVREQFPKEKKYHLRSEPIFGKEQRKAMAEFYRNAIVEAGPNNANAYAAMYLAADMLRKDDPSFSVITFTNYVHTGDSTSFVIK